MVRLPKLPLSMTASEVEMVSGPDTGAPLGDQGARVARVHSIGLPVFDRGARGCCSGGYYRGPTLGRIPDRRCAHPMGGCGGAVTWWCCDLCSCEVVL